MIQKLEVLRLYRDILKAARLMPTQNRRDFIQKKARAEFKKSKNVTDSEEQAFLFNLGETQLDTIQLQAQHLTQLHEMEHRLLVPVELPGPPKLPPLEKKPRTLAELKEILAREESHRKK
eukprot:Colp12_sorted_trinity150504_noHs@25670